MKKIIKNIFYIITLTSMLFSAACSDIFEEVKDLKTDRLFKPISFAYSLNKTKATLTWVAVKDAESYTLQVSDDVDFNHLVVNDTLMKTTFVKELAGSTNYYARVKTNASAKVPSSNFTAALEFKTPSENIFEGYTTLMTALHTVTVNWLPSANASHLVLTAADETTSTVSLSAADVAAGKVVLPSLANSAYKVQIYNGAFLRGAVNVLVEGDVYLAAGQDLPAAIATATAGQVIVLEPGATFLTGSSVIRFDKNIKIRGLLPNNLPILAMTTGTPTATSSMLGFADNSIIDFVKFQNLDFTGYCNNDLTAIKIGYLFNNNLMTTVNTLLFDNCKLHNLGNTPFRLQGNKSQVIDNIIFKNSSIWEVGFSSTYALVNSNSTDFVNNVTFDGCTVYNFKGSLVLRTGAYTMASINIANCTINQGMQDPSSARYLIDASNTTITNGITIRNCIFGSSAGALGANGVRNTNTAGTVISVLTVTGSFYTTDYVDDPLTVVTSYSIKKYMTAFTGASTALWNNPTTGDFTLKASSFAGKGLAGDLRWY